MPRTGGGATTRMLPAVIVPSDARSWLATVSPLARWPFGLSATNMAAALGALEKVAPSKPAKATVSAVAGLASAILCAWPSTSVVRCSEAPGGICTTPIR